jgi:hypothetical protein
VNDEPPKYVTITFSVGPVAGYWPWYIRVRWLLKIAGRWLRLRCELVEYDLAPRPEPVRKVKRCGSRTKKS